jgi:hypothetical protein
MIYSFDTFNITSIPHNQNIDADILANNHLGVCLVVMVFQLK